MPAIHQAPLVREVARQAGVPVYVLVADDVSAVRREQGWRRPDFEPAVLHIKPDDTVTTRLLREDPDTTVHIFSGIHAYPFVSGALRQACETSATVGVYSEPQRPDGWKGPLRLLRNRWNARVFGRRLSFVLATGENGVNWYRRSGFAPAKIFPFAYFVAEPPAIAEAAANATAPFQLLFVGELAPHKGFDLLLHALSTETGTDWILNVVGNGTHRSTYEALAQRLGLSSRVRWHGTMLNEDVRHLMAQADLFVLPSRFDGWGAVVNEALSVGTPVVCSDACGSSDMIRHPDAGLVFDAGSVSSLRGALRTRLGQGHISTTARQRLRKWAERIGPRAGARYLLDIIDFARRGGTAHRPVAPWRSGMSLDDGRSWSEWN